MVMTFLPLTRTYLDSLERVPLKGISFFGDSSSESALILEDDSPGGEGLLGKPRPLGPTLRVGESCVK